MPEAIAKAMVSLPDEDVQQMLVVAAKLRNAYARPDAAVGRDAALNRMWSTVYAFLADLLAAERDSRVKTTKAIEQELRGF